MDFWNGFSLFFVPSICYLWHRSRLLLTGFRSTLSSPFPDVRCRSSLGYCFDRHGRMPSVDRLHGERRKQPPSAHRPGDGGVQGL